MDDDSIVAIDVENTDRVDLEPLASRNCRTPASAVWLANGAIVGFLSGQMLLQRA